MLTRASQLIRESSPAGAPLGRLGGEEFAMALRNVGIDEARVLAERVRAAIAAAPFETKEATLPVTISIGVAQVNSLPATSADLLRRADEQLYRAKQEGRNRVCAEE